MNRSKSGLFLIELIIAVGFFALASAVCIQLFAAAHSLRTRSFGLQMAVVSAQSAAESFKATGANAHRMGELLGGDLTGTRLTLGYDENWVPVRAQTARYLMVVEIDTSEEPALAAIIVEDTAMDELLYSLTAKSYLGL